MAKNRQFVTFYVEERWYGLDIRMVKEINPTVDITPVPRTPRHVKGLVNIRGQVVLVTDIAVIFGRSPLPIVDESQIVILKTAAELQTVRELDAEVDGTPFGDKPIGFLVDRIGEVIIVPAAELDPVPPHLAETNARCLEGVAHLDDRILVILDAAEMLSHAGNDLGAMTES